VKKINHIDRYNEQRDSMYVATIGNPAENIGYIGILSL
jgi:hypothetical protein